MPGCPEDKPGRILEEPLLTLTRLDRQPTHTRGVLHLEGARPWVTIECPWIPCRGYGEPGKSCIPEGIYRLEQAQSPKWGMRWHIIGEGVHLRKHDTKDPFERWGCMFHPANWASQIQGCIALGWEWRTMRDAAAVTDSRSAVGEFERAMAGIHAPRLRIISA